MTAKEARDITDEALKPGNSPACRKALDAIKTRALEGFSYIKYVHLDFSEVHLDFFRSLGYEITEPRREKVIKDWTCPEGYRTVVAHPSDPEGVYYSGRISW